MEIAPMFTLAEVETQTLFIAVGGAVAIVAIVAGSLNSMIKTRAREMSRREIAAYIAEGTMTAEQGERLMKAAPEEDDD